MRGISGPEFKAAIAQHREALFGWAIRRVGPDDAEDLVQDALLHAVAVKTRPRSSWRTWLFAIAGYVLKEHWSAQIRKVAVVPLEEACAAVTASVAY